MRFDRIEKDEEVKHYRLDMSYEEYTLLIEMLNELQLGDRDFDTKGRFEGYQERADTLFAKVRDIKRIGHGKKHIATLEANRSKILESKKKINNAINLLRLEGRDITPYAVAKTAAISYNTAKKYLAHLPKSSLRSQTLFES